MLEQIFKRGFSQQKSSVEAAYEKLILPKAELTRNEFKRLSGNEKEELLQRLESSPMRLMGISATESNIINEYMYSTNDSSSIFRRVMSESAALSVINSPLLANSSTVTDRKTEERSELDPNEHGLHNRIYREMQPDPAYLEQVQDRVKNIVSSLVKDQEIVRSARSWLNLSTEEREKATERMVSVIQKALGLEDLTVEIITNKEEAKQKLGDSFGKCQGEKIFIALPTIEHHLNQELEESYPDIPNDQRSIFHAAFVAKSISHEIEHVFQHQLITRLRSGKLSPDSPLFEVAKQFCINDYDYASTNENQEEYKHQPVEDYARFAGTAVFNGLVGRKKPKAL